MFSGMNFSGYMDCDNLNYAYTDNITYVTMTGLICDEFFASHNNLLSHLESVKLWDYDTIFFAQFKNSLMAGNVDYAASIVNSMLVKRRKKTDFNWITLFEIPIKNNNDFSFERIDRYAKGNTEYIYSLLPVISGVEGEMNLSEIKSEFEGAFLIEKDVSFWVNFNLSLNTQKNHNGSTQIPIGSKYPYFISNGNSNYYTGNVSCTFLQMINCKLQLENGAYFRSKVDEFLVNGNPKIFKIFDGRIYMINITDSINQDNSNYYLPTHSFSFVEVGDTENQLDLYDNNFIDVKHEL